MLHGAAAVARTGVKAIKSAARGGTSAVALQVTAAAAKALHAPAAAPLHVDATVAAPKLPARSSSVPVREERLPSPPSRTTQGGALRGSSLLEPLRIASRISDATAAAWLQDAAASGGYEGANVAFTSPRSSTSSLLASSSPHRLRADAGAQGLLPANRSGGPRKLSAASFMGSLASRGFGVQQGVGTAFFSTSTAAGRPFVPLIKVGDGGKWDAFEDEKLMDMRRTALLEALASSRIFGPDLTDVKLGACTVSVLKGALPEDADEPTAAYEASAAAVELKGAKTVGEVAGAGPFFVRVSPPEVAPPPCKRFVLLVNREDEDGDMETHPLPVAVDTDAELKELVHANGGGNLVKEGAEGERVRRVAEIVEGGTYELIGGQSEAVKRHRMWTQVSDSVLEEDATLAVLADTTYGPLEEFTEYDPVSSKEPPPHSAKDSPPAPSKKKSFKVLRDATGKEKELDGIAVNCTTAVIVEAKHHAEPKHIKIVKDKAEHVLRVAQEGRIGRLKDIKATVPVLAASMFSPAMVELCKMSGVGVVKPNGKRLSFIHHPARCEMPVAAGAESPR